MEVLFDQYKSFEDYTGMNYYKVNEKLKKYGKLCYHLGLESYYLIPNEVFIEKMMGVSPEESQEQRIDRRKETLEYIAQISREFSCGICITHPIFFDIHLVVIAEGKFLKSIF